MATAGRVLARRGKELTEADRALFELLHAGSAEYRRT